MADMIKLVEAWLAVLPSGDFDACPGTVAEDFVLRLPFVPPGVPNAFEGGAAAQAVLQASAKGRSPLVFTDKVIRRTEHPELALTTARASATMASGKPYANQYVMRTRIRGQTVVEHVEYLNPLAVIAAAG